MNIEDFKAAKRRMEDEIREAVLASTYKFWGETGYTPHSISIYLLPKISINSKRMQHVVGEVKAEVEL